MAFIEIKRFKHGYNNRPHKIRVGFYSEKTGKKAIRILIPVEIGESIGIGTGDRVSFAYDDLNLRTWLIKKNNEGFKCSALGKNLNIIRLNINNRFGIIPTEDDFKTREVEHDFYEGGLRIFS